MIIKNDHAGRNKIVKFQQKNTIFLNKVYCRYPYSVNSDFLVLLIIRSP